MAFVSMAASFSVEETAILMGLGVVVGERKMLVVREFEDAVSPIEVSLAVQHRRYIVHQSDLLPSLPRSFVKQTVSLCWQLWRG